MTRSFYVALALSAALLAPLYAHAQVQGGTTLSTPVSVTQGGTGSTTSSAARINLGVAASGANVDITSLTGITTPIPEAEGGTGQTDFGAATLTPTGGSSGSLNSFLSGGTVIPGIFTSLLQLSGTTIVASLPACNSGSAGQERTVSDALAPSYAVALTGGGAVNLKARCNGASWVAD